MCTIGILFSLQRLFCKIDMFTIKNAFIKLLTKDLPYTLITADKIDTKLQLLINVTDIAIAFVIAKARMYPNLVSEFDL